MLRKLDNITRPLSLGFNKNLNKSLRLNEFVSYLNKVKKSFSNNDYCNCLSIYDNN
jgi:hypothetical protein